MGHGELLALAYIILAHIGGYRVVLFFRLAVIECTVVLWSPLWWMDVRMYGDGSMLI
jgi:hypothetical protein